MIGKDLDIQVTETERPGGYTARETAQRLGVETPDSVRRFWRQGAIRRLAKDLYDARSVEEFRQRRVQDGLLPPDVSAFAGSGVSA